MFSESILMLKDGKIVSLGDAKDVLEKEKLKSVYGIDIKNFMLEALGKWK